MGSSETADGGPRGVGKVFPILGWIPSYRRAWLGRDVVAGVIVMYLLVQEGMACAQIAGMPPQTVFYVAPAALLLSTIFANSHKLVVGSATQTALSKGAEAALATAASRPRRRQRGQLRPLPLRSRAPLPPTLAPA